MEKFGEYCENPEAKQTETEQVKQPEQKADFEKVELKLLTQALRKQELGEKESKLVAQFINGTLNTKNEVKFSAARNLWWVKKFGFPYNNRRLREVLLAAIEKYSDDEKTADVLARSVAFFENEKTLNSLIEQNNGKWDDKMRAIVLAITKFRADICEIIEKQSQNNNICQDYWNIITKLAWESGNKSQIENLRKSTLSQVAVSLGLKKIGLNPNQVDCEVDAFQMIDLRAGTDVFQIKTGKTIPEIIIESSNNIAANGVVFQRNGDLAVINLDGEKFTIKSAKIQKKA